MAKRRTFTPEFKAQVVLEELTGVKDKAETCRDVRIDVCDEQGDALPVIDSDEGSNFGEHRPYGIISVPSDGEYSFVTDSQRVAYVTEPMDAGAYVGEIGRGFFLGIPLALAGTALIVAGIVLLLLGTKGKR